MTDPVMTSGNKRKDDKWVWGNSGKFVLYKFDINEPNGDSSSRCDDMQKLHDFELDDDSVHTVNVNYVKNETKRTEWYCESLGSKCICTLNHFLFMYDFNI